MSSVSTTVGVVGLGRMGAQLAIRAATVCDRVLGFDSEPDRGRGLTGVERVNDPESLSVAKLIILAVPGPAVPELAADYSASWAKACIVDVCTQRNHRDDAPLFGASRLIIAKIIAEADMVAENVPGAVFLTADDSVSAEHLKVAQRLFATIGTLSVNQEGPEPGTLNRIAAHAAMRAVIDLAVRLRSAGADPATIDAAVRNVFIGTARQFPFAPPDYFHQLVLASDPGLAESYERLREGDHGAQ